MERNRQVLATKPIYRNGGEKKGVADIGGDDNANNGIRDMEAECRRGNVNLNPELLCLRWQMPCSYGGQQVFLVKTSSSLGLLLPLLTSTVGS